MTSVVERWSEYYYLFFHNRDTNRDLSIIAMQLLLYVFLFVLIIRPQKLPRFSAAHIAAIVVGVSVSVVLGTVVHVCCDIALITAREEVLLIYSYERVFQLFLLYLFGLSVAVLLVTAFSGLCCRSPITQAKT